MNLMFPRAVGNRQRTNVKGSNTSPRLTQHVVLERPNDWGLGAFNLTKRQSVMSENFLCPSRAPYTTPRRLFHPPLPPPSSLWLDRQHRGSMRVHLATATSLARHSLHPFLPSFFFEWVSPSLFSESEVILKTCFIPSLLPSFFVTRAAPDLLSLSSHLPVI